MKRIMLLFVLLLLLLIQLDAMQEEEEKERLLRTRMSTKTIYPAPEQEENQDEEGCRPLQLNYVIRHGTRFPTIKDITRINALHSKLLVLNASQSWLKEWRNPYDPAQAGWLADAGREELVALGERIRHNVEMTAHFHPSKFVFEHTWKPRTRQSAMAFAFGFFQQQQQPVFYETDAIGSDQELRFFDNCPAFDLQINQNKSATLHHAMYRQSPQMQRNLRKFQQFLGPNAHEMTQKDMEAAYAGCAFDVATQGFQTDHWCSFFDAEMLQSMDYFHDLKHFYKKSHGNALAYEIASPLLQDMVRSMQDRVDHKTQVEGHFRFAHAETILPFASLLNLSYFDRHANDRDGHFLADTPLEVAETRKFKGAVLSPFAANIGFVLYECQQHYGVKMLMNERLVRLKECEHQALCPFERFKSLYHRWIHEYDFHKECRIDLYVDS